LKSIALENKNRKQTFKNRITKKIKCDFEKKTLTIKNWHKDCEIDIKGLNEVKQRLRKRKLQIITQ
jgi:hypothetical protein